MNVSVDIPVFFQNTTLHAYIKINSNLISVTIAKLTFRRILDYFAAVQKFVY